MTDSIPNPDSNSDTDVGPGREYPGMPRWVKMSGIIVIGLVLLVVIMMFIIGGDQGPGRHTPPIEHGEQQP